MNAVAINARVLDHLRISDSLSPAQAKMVPSREDIQDAAHMEAVLCCLEPLCFRSQNQEFTASELWTVVADLKFRLSGCGTFFPIDVNVAHPKRSTMKDVRRERCSHDALRPIAKQAIKRLKWALNRRFEKPDDAQLIALILDPRTIQAAEDLLVSKKGTAEEDDKMLLRARDLLKEAIKNQLIAERRVKSGSSASVASATSTRISTAVGGASKRQPGLGVPISRSLLATLNEVESSSACWQQYDDIEEYIGSKVPQLFDLFTNALKQYNHHLHLREESKIEDLITVGALCRHCHIKQFVMNEIKPKLPMLFRIMQIYLGTVESSSFVERMFSSAGLVWSENKTRKSVNMVECQTVLRMAGPLLQRYKEEWCMEDMAL